MFIINILKEFGFFNKTKKSENFKVMIIFISKENQRAYVYIKV